MVMTGSGGESQTIKLEMTIDKAELERQLGTIFQPKGSGGPLGGAGGGTSVGGRGASKKPVMVDAAGKMLKGMKYLGGLVGIGLTLSAMLKLSKIMAAVSSALQSILGAMVDSFLAPFMPMFETFIKWLAKGIGPAGEVGRGIADTMMEAKNLQQAGKDKRDRMKAEHGDAAGETLFWGNVIKIGAESVLDVLKLAAQGMATPQERKKLQEHQWTATSGQRAAQAENAAREELGMPKLTWWKSTFGPLAGDLTTTRQQKTENTFNINIIATDREGILREVDENLRDLASQSSVGGK